MSDWKQVGENLVRHVGGTIYLRAKVKGKVIRVSLGTEDLRIAKIARDDRLAAMRGAAAMADQNPAVRTVGDAVAVVASRLLDQPALKKPTIDYYRAMIRILNETLPVTIHGRSWTSGEASGWWKRIAGRYAWQRANNVLGVCKQVGKVLVEMGLRLDDPTARLKRLPARERDSSGVPSLKTIEAIVESIRIQGKSRSNESADYVAFLAFAGCRHGQAKAFQWKHDEGQWLKFPAGIEGTKGAATRRLPISPPLRAVLDRIRARAEKVELESKIFQINTPRIALDNACERLGIPHVRIHDLRHFFASYAIGCGVDIPTVAKWLGHKDGGKLLLVTYSHIHDQQSLANAQKLKVAGSSDNLLPSHHFAIGQDEERRRVL
jgi:integrase